MYFRVFGVFSVETLGFSCVLGLRGGSGDDFGAIVWPSRSRTRPENAPIAHLGSILELISDPEINNFGYRFYVYFVRCFLSLSDGFGVDFGAILVSKE